MKPLILGQNRPFWVYIKDCSVTHYGKDKYHTMTKTIVAGQLTKQANIHAGILKDFTLNINSDRSYGYNKVERTVAIKLSGTTKIPKRAEEKVASTGVVLYPEFVEYIFHLEGVGKKLLMFIIFHQLNPQKNTFLFNTQVVATFNRYCMAVTGATYKEETAKQALRKELVARNIVINVEKGKYMLNPMVGGCNNFQLRRTLIAEYSNLLIQKGKDPFTDFYPKY